MFLFQPGTPKSTFKGCYSNVPFSARDLKRYIMRILHGRTFSAHFLRIFMRTYFFTPWTSRVFYYIAYFIPMKNPWVTAGSAPCATQPHPALGGHADDHRFTTGKQGGDGAETSHGFPMVFQWFSHVFPMVFNFRSWQTRISLSLHISYWYLEHLHVSSSIIICHHLSSTIIIHHWPSISIYQHLSSSIII